MRRYCLEALVYGALLCAAPFAVFAQQDAAASLRPPATPLIVHDPYFSIWSNTDTLTGGSTRHWTGTQQPLNGLIRVDGKTYRYLGDADRRIPAFEQVREQVTPTRTVVDFQSSEIDLTLTFLTPAFPNDLTVLARPVTYLTWDVRSRDGRTHNVAIYFDASGSVAVNQTDEPVVWSRAEIHGLHLLRLGSQQQPVLGRSGDNLRVNWGYFYLGVPDADAAEVAAGDQFYRNQFAASGHIPNVDDLEQPLAPNSRFPAAPALNVVLPLGGVGAAPVSRHILVGYDDLYSIEYMRQKLLAYWHKEFGSFGALLEGAERDYLPLKQRSEAYDAELTHDLAQEGGSEYAAIAAHKLVEDDNGVPFFMPKENFSNGSISTVDVISPSAPMFPFLNPNWLRRS